MQIIHSTSLQSRLRFWNSSFLRSYDHADTCTTTLCNSLFYNWVSLSVFVIVLGISIFRAVVTKIAKKRCYSVQVRPLLYLRLGLVNLSTVKIAACRFPVPSPGQSVRRRNWALLKSSIKGRSLNKSSFLLFCPVCQSNWLGRLCLTAQARLASQSKAERAPPLQLPLSAAESVGR